MYNEYFRFSETPFTIAPNPRYLYLSEQHREALAHLKYGLGEKGGFILLTGDVGTGKTTVCRCFLEQVSEEARVALLINPPLNETELLQAICDEFGIDHSADANVNQLTALLNRFLLDLHAEGRYAIVVAEEAQHLDRTMLERLRLLTNLETDEQKLMQVVLIGQPELLETIARPELQQLAQRIIARYHLKPLRRKDMEAYLQHRLKVAGGSIALFPETVRLLLFNLSKGVPRVINLICDRALLGCYAQGKTVVDVRTLKDAAREVSGRVHGSSAMSRWRLAGAAASMVLVLATGYGVLKILGVEEHIQAVTASPEQYAQPAAAGTASGDKAQGTIVDAGAGGGAHGMDGAQTRTIAGATAAVAALPSGGGTEAFEWPDVITGGFSARDAYQAVFDAWNAGSIPAGLTPCEFANHRGLDCWNGDTPFKVLQRINRPAVIKLLDREGKPFYVALLALDDRRATVQAGTRQTTAGHEKLRSAWTGEYTILWRRPRAYVNTLKPGYTGDMLPWLENKLAEVHNTAMRESRTYDARVASAVRRVQRECRLLVDGLMGRETLIMLNSLTEDVPLLSGERKRVCGRKLL